MSECSAIGAVNGALLMGMCLTWELSFVASAASLGAFYGVVYSQGLRHFINKEVADNNQMDQADSKYVDK